MAGNVNINEVLQIGSIGGSTGNCKLVVYSSDSYGNAAIFKHPDDTRGLAIRYNEIIATNANNDFNMTVSGTGRLLFNSGGSLRMRITNTGNVGIGTDPSQKLEVDGVLKLVGNPNPVNDNMGVYLWNQANVGPTISGASFEVRTGGDIARMRILNNGNAGIGTTDPQHKLDIQGSAAQTLRIMDTRATGDAIIALKETNDNNGFDMAYIGTAGDRFYIRGYNNSATPRVDFTIDRITSNVGIGMTDPKYKLDVAGTINASNILINGSIVTANNQQWITSSSNVYTSNLSGNVGIGTTAPQSKLTINPIVSQNNYFNHSEAPLTITNPTPTSSTVINDPKSVLHLCREGTQGQAYGARASFKLCRYENSFPNSRSRLDITLAHNEYDDINTMSILSGGNVGIGRTNPTELLHVNGNFKAEGSIVSGSGADMLSGNHIFTTATSGRLGIGINPNTPTTSIAHLHRTTANTEVKLQFTDGTTLSTSTDGLTLYKGTDQIGYLWNYENADLVFGTNSTERMRITSGGNVGISRTPNASYKLDVNGDMFVEANLIFNGQFNGGGRNFPCNKIDLLNGGRNYGFGVSGNILDYFAFTTHRFFTGAGGTNFGTERFTITDNGVFFQNGVWHKSLDNLERVSFNASGTTIIKGHGVKPIEFRNGSDGVSMVITSGNEVGIGTATPLSGNKLHVEGNAYLNGISTINGNLVVNSNLIVHGSTTTLNTDVFTTERLELTNAGSSTSFTLSQTAPGNANNILNVINSTTSNVFNITSTGNIGIGTTNPANKLDIQGSSAQTLRIMDTRATGDAIIALKELNDSNGFDMAYIGTTGDKFYIRSYNNSATPRVDFAIDRATGNIGIGTTNPNANLHLHGNAASQNVRISFSDNTSGVATTDGFCIGKDTAQVGYIYNTESNAISIGTNNTERIRILADGNVGIGMTNPQRRLEVLQHMRISGSGSVLDFGNDFNVQIYRFLETNQIRITTGGIDRLSINENGSVGIGRTNPTELLHVNGNFKAEGSIVSGSGADMLSGNHIFTTATSGRLGIGINPNTPTTSIAHLHRTTANTEVKLQFTDGTTLSTATDGLTLYKGTDQIGYLWNYENADLVFGTNSTERIRIASGGNVGIGTNNPLKNLHILQTHNSGGTIDTASLDITEADLIVSSMSSHTSKKDAGIMFFANGSASTNISYASGFIKSGWTTAGSTAWNKSYIDFNTHGTNTTSWTTDMRIQGGNVGIGTTNPGYKLDVAGTINATNILINGSIISASSSQWITSGTNIYNNNTGNVGIGTTAPNSVLDIVRTSASGVAVDMLNTRFDNNWGLKVQQNYVGGGDIRYNLIHRYNAIDYNSLTFKGANVGIGTTNPSAYTLQVNGTIGASGNITASYSDERLKNITEYVSDVLPILSKINVFKYNCNDLAASYGYDKNKKEIGLSAQEVQKYYPEVVSIAPFDSEYDEETKNITSKSGENYLTLDYERLVPILLQGIKDLNNKVVEMEENEKNMKNELNNIKSRLDKLELR
jgi:hypothetical protein